MKLIWTEDPDHTDTPPLNSNNVVEAEIKPVIMACAYEICAGDSTKKIQRIAESTAKITYHLIFNLIQDNDE